MSKEPKYTVLESHDEIELRLYEPFMVAEVKISGVRKEAIRSGFRILANYIFGGNKTSTKIPMSIPVTQQKTGNLWRIRFMLTEASDLKNPPKPNDPLIELLSIPEKKFAAIRFSGIFSDKKIQKYTEKLQNHALSRKWTLNKDPILAFYNPPWTLFFLRRNEILIEILQ